MKIDITELSKAVNKFITVEQYIVLKIIEDGCLYLFPNNLFAATIVGLKSSGYIYSETQLTPKGKELLKEISGNKISKKVDTGINQLYIACQEELQKLVGKKQKTSKINGKSYSFLPNFVDFQDKIEKSCKKYQLNDKEQLKKVLLQYINKCHKEDNWFPILEYYIMKDGHSKLATDYVSFEEIQEIKQNNKGVIDI